MCINKIAISRKVRRTENKRKRRIKCYAFGSKQTATQFTRAVDAACVYVNVSTAFTDGGQFGFGAEVGISTQKLHARGPMGLPELTTYKYVVTGDGQIRES